MYLFTSETLNISKGVLFLKIERVEFNQRVMSRFYEQFNRIFAVRNLRLDVSRANATNSCSEVYLSMRSLNRICFWLGALLTTDDCLAK